MSRFHYIVFLVLFLNVHSTSHAQKLEFSRDLKGAPGSWRKIRDMQFDAQGNVLLAGTLLDSGSQLIMLSKWNDRGEQLWNFTYGEAGRQAELQVLKQDNAGNLFLLGNTRTYKNHSQKLLLIKCDSLGRMIWKKYIESGAFRIFSSDMAIDAQGNTWVLGWKDNEKGDYDYHLIRYDSSGGFKWSYTYDGGRNDYAKSIALDNHGNAVITGTRTNAASKYDICTIKLDARGNELWRQEFDGPVKGSEEPVSVSIDKKGNVHLAGTTDAGNLTKNFLAIKYNKRGKLQWYQVFDGGRADFVNSAVLDSKGNFYLGGYSESPSGQYAATLLKWSKKGKQRLAIMYTGNSGSYTCNEICTDNKGNVLLAGAWLQNQVDSRYFVAIFDDKGHMSWSHTQPALGTMQFAVHCIMKSRSEFYIAVDRREADGLWNFRVLKFAVPKGNFPSKVNTLTN